MKIATSEPKVDWHDMVMAMAQSAEYAYQPIVSMTSLRVHGFEALARLPATSGYADITGLLDDASEADALLSVERVLLAKSITTFARLPDAQQTRLFCNLDNRVFDHANVSPQTLVDLARASSLDPANICIELSERRPPESVEALARMVDVFMNHNVRIAIDDFGQGFSGLNMLMTVEPHYVKIDRAFIDGLSRNAKKLAIVSSLANLAHSLGFLIVAEGVETESDFRAARDLGCDLAQGYLIARPTTRLSDLRMAYDHISGVRHGMEIPSQIAELLAPVMPLRIDASLADAVAMFKDDPSARLVPVVDADDYVHGAIFEEDIREYLLTEFGMALLANKGLHTGIEKLVRRCALGEASATIDAIISTYAAAKTEAGLILTLDGRYVGYLTNHAVLRLAAQRDVAVARDQNPLTCLPGNGSILHHVDDVLRRNGAHVLALFDFDHFKAFNDIYGFLTGDRALLMFADLLVKMQREHHAFIGHVGGDDFFLSLAGPVDRTVALIRELTAKFASNVESLYSSEDRARGGVLSTDRFGEQRFFPLLRASAAALVLPVARAHLTRDEVNATLAAGKTQSKQQDAGLALLSLPQTAVEDYRLRIEQAAVGG